MEHEGKKSDVRYTYIISVRQLFADQQTCCQSGCPSQILIPRSVERALKTRDRAFMWKYLVIQPNNPPTWSPDLDQNILCQRVKQV